MGIFKNLSGRLKKQEVSSLSPTPHDLSKIPNLIKWFDDSGREFFVTRKAWRDSILIGSIEKAWNDAKQLETITIQALQDKFFKEAIRPAERLYELVPDTEQSACILGITYLKNNRLDDAERILTRFNQRFGESGSVTTNIAKVFSARGEHERALSTLWHALEIDPNQDNGFLWYVVMYQEKEGEAAASQAMRRVATLPNSWRAQLWLARDMLKEKKLPEAMTVYRDTLQKLNGAIPSDALMQISGDLGNQGFFTELIELTAPRFDADTHGLLVGINLIKAYLEFKQIDEARKIVNALLEKKRPDWNKTLDFWQAEIATSK